MARCLAGLIAPRLWSCLLQQLYKNTVRNQMIQRWPQSGELPTAYSCRRKPPTSSEVEDGIDPPIHPPTHPMCNAAWPTKAHDSETVITTLFKVDMFARLGSSKQLGAWTCGYRPVQALPRDTCKRRGFVSQPKPSSLKHKSSTPKPRKGRANTNESKRLQARMPRVPLQYLALSEEAFWVAQRVRAWVIRVPMNR